MEVLLIIIISLTCMVGLVDAQGKKRVRRADIVPTMVVPHVAAASSGDDEGGAPKGQIILSPKDAREYPQLFSWKKGPLNTGLPNQVRDRVRSYACVIKTPAVKGKVPAGLVTVRAQSNKTFSYQTASRAEFEQYPEGQIVEFVPRMTNNKDKRIQQMDPFKLHVNPALVRELCAGSVILPVRPHYLEQLQAARLQTPQGRIERLRGKAALPPLRSGAENPPAVSIMPPVLLPPPVSTPIPPTPLTPPTLGVPPPHPVRSGPEIPPLRTNHEKRRYVPPHRLKNG